MVAEPLGADWLIGNVMVRPCREDVTRCYKRVRLAAASGEVQMKTPSAKTETDRARDRLQEDRLAKLQETLRRQDAPPRSRTGDRSKTVPGAWTEGVEFWDNVPL